MVEELSRVCSIIAGHGQAKEELATEAEKLARQVASASPLTLAMGKRSFYDQLERPEPEAFNLATRTMALNLAGSARVALASSLARYCKSEGTRAG